MKKAFPHELRILHKHSLQCCEIWTMSHDSHKSPIAGYSAFWFLGPDPPSHHLRRKDQRLLLPCTRENASSRGAWWCSRLSSSRGCWEQTSPASRCPRWPNHSQQRTRRSALQGRGGCHRAQGRCWPQAICAPGATRLTCYCIFHFFSFFFFLKVIFLSVF